MVQFLPPINQGPSKQQMWGDAFAKGAGSLARAYSEKQEENRQLAQKKENYNKANQFAKKVYGSDYELPTDPKLQEISLKGAVETYQKMQELKSKQDFQNQIMKKYDMGENPELQEQEPSNVSEKGNPQEISNPSAEETPKKSALKKGFDPTKISDKDILALSAVNPQAANLLQKEKDTALREEREKSTREQKTFEKEREYHTSFSRKQVEEADVLAKSLPKKQMALDYSRDAIESGDVGAFSLNSIADATGINAFRTAKGAQLITAAKENLLSNMGKVSAKAQNQWFEQRLMSMLPKIGQTEGANLTTQEMLEAEVEMDNAYLKEFNKIRDSDNKEYKYERKDIARRAEEAVKHTNKVIFDRSVYRMKEIEEKEMGLSKMKSQIGKKVVRGSPLTLGMAKLYYQKYGDKAETHAKKDGYSIPSKEDLNIYMMNPSEFRETYE